MPGQGTCRGRFPWGLLGAALLALVVEGTVARRPLDLLDADDWAYREAKRAASREAKGADVLCFGDSLVKLAVLPKVLDEHAGLSAHNLAVSGSQPTASAELLRRSLDAGARPSAVVVDFFPKLFSLSPRHNLWRWSALLGPSGAAGLARASDDPGLFGSVVAAGLLPSLRCRDSIRAQVFARLTGGPNPRRWGNVVIRRNWDRNLGAQPMPGTGDVARLTSEGADAHSRAYFGAFACHPGNADGIGRFLELAAGRGIPVFWLLPPVAPAVRARARESGFDAEHRAFVEGWCGRYPNVRMIDGSAAFDDPAAFFDAHHLAAPGASAFSRALGETLRDALARPPAGNANRRLTLSRCAPEQDAGGPEDLDQTRLAVAEGGPRRRR